MFGVETEKDAEALIIMTCPRGMDGKYYAKELAQEQTLENLVAFSDLLQKAWDFMQENRAKRKANA